jgi:DNA-binding PadR family transcriptional regulator
MSEMRARLHEREPDPWLLTLASMGDGPRHGDGMIDEIESLFGVRPSLGTLRGVVARLARHGLVGTFITEAGLVEPFPTGDRRLLYQLTVRGAEVAGDEFVRLADLMRTRKIAIEQAHFAAVGRAIA